MAALLRKSVIFFLLALVSAHADAHILSGCADFFESLSSHTIKLSMFYDVANAVNRANLSVHDVKTMILTNPRRPVVVAENAIAPIQWLVSHFAENDMDYSLVFNWRTDREIQLINIAPASAEEVSKFKAEAELNLASHRTKLTESAEEDLKAAGIDFENFRWMLRKTYGPPIEFPDGRFLTISKSRAHREYALEIARQPQVPMVIQKIKRAPVSMGKTYFKLAGELLKFNDEVLKIQKGRFKDTPVLISANILVKITNKHDVSLEDLEQAFQKAPAPLMTESGTMSFVTKLGWHSYLLVYFVHEGTALRLASAYYVPKVKYRAFIDASKPERRWRLPNQEEEDEAEAEGGKAWRVD